MQGDLTALIERAEKATGPDRELDLAICSALGCDMTGYEDAIGLGSETYTSSLDAALALVEEKLPDCDWECTTARHRKGFMATVWYADVFRADATTPALAIVLALLRALQSQQENSEVKDAG